jgi:hypothetical protein
MFKKFVILRLVLFRCMILWRKETSKEFWFGNIMVSNHLENRAYWSVLIYCTYIYMCVCVCVCVCECVCVCVCVCVCPGEMLCEDKMWMKMVLYYRVFGFPNY